MTLGSAHYGQIRGCNSSCWGYWSACLPGGCRGLLQCYRENMATALSLSIRQMNHGEKLHVLTTQRLIWMRIFQKKKLFIVSLGSSSCTVLELERGFTQLRQCVGVRCILQHPDMLLLCIRCCSPHSCPLLPFFTVPSVQRRVCRAGRVSD